tara:strand:- start:55 stop:480 length:426 start_codon:yes stop_codon:yes gene_type:complete
MFEPITTQLHSIIRIDYYGDSECNLYKIEWDVKFQDKKHNNNKLLIKNGLQLPEYVFISIEQMDYLEDPIVVMLQIQMNIKEAWPYSQSIQMWKAKELKIKNWELVKDDEERESVALQYMEQQRQKEFHYQKTPTLNDLIG